MPWPRNGRLLTPPAPTGTGPSHASLPLLNKTQHQRHNSFQYIYTNFFYKKNKNHWKHYQLRKSDERCRQTVPETDSKHAFQYVVNVLSNERSDGQRHHADACKHCRVHRRHLLLPATTCFVLLLLLLFFVPSVVKAWGKACCTPWCHLPHVTISYCSRSSARGAVWSGREHVLLPITPHYYYYYYYYYYINCTQGTLINTRKKYNQIENKINRYIKGEWHN